ncbi:MAG: hypothetical protein H0U37_02740 [Chloroflexi bacterium]|nr:hypothetical protein [Chloroflexota bacterium]
MTDPRDDQSTGPRAAPEPIAFERKILRPGALRVGLVASAALALIVGAAATSLAASPHPAASAAPVEDDLGWGGMAGILGGFAGPGELGGPGDGGPGDLGRRGHGGLHDITIASIDGANVSIKTDDGWSRTIAITSTTTLKKGSQTIALSDLKAGDQVHVAQTRNGDGAYTVTALAVVVPSIAGTVSDLTSSGFKITARNGSVWTITTDDSTVYRFGTVAGSASDLKDGGLARVHGGSAGDNALNATTVQVAGDGAIGTVTAKSSDTITLKTQDGSSLTVHVDGDTVYHVKGKDAATLADITVDMVVGVQGRDRADGSFDASTVASGPHGAKGGRGRFGRHGPRGFGGPGWLNPKNDHPTEDGTPDSSPSTSSFSG